MISFEKEREMVNLRLFDVELGSEFSAWDTMCLGGLPFIPLPVERRKIDECLALFKPSLLNLPYYLLRSD